MPKCLIAAQIQGQAAVLQRLTPVVLQPNYYRRGWRKSSHHYIGTCLIVLLPAGIANHQSFRLSAAPQRAGELDSGHSCLRLPGTPCSSLSLPRHLPEMNLKDLEERRKKEYSQRNTQWHSVSKQTRAAEGTVVEQSMHHAMYLEEKSTETKVRTQADDSRFVHDGLAVDTYLARR